MRTNQPRRDRGNTGKKQGKRDMAGVYSAKINHFLTTFAQNGVVNVGIDGKSKERTKKEKSLEFQCFQALKPLIWRAIRDSNP